jgi:hypothetical protein
MLSSHFCPAFDPQVGHAAANICSEETFVLLMVGSIVAEQKCYG